MTRPMRMFVIVSGTNGEVCATEAPESNAENPLLRGMTLANRYFPKGTTVTIDTVYAEDVDTAIDVVDNAEWLGTYTVPHD